MKAAVYSRYGTPDVLTIVDDYPLPAVQPDTIRVRVRACAVNPKDVFIRKGRFRFFTWGSFPRQTGFDFAGVVDAVPDDYQGDLHVGDAVYGHLDGVAGGSAAEYVTVPQEKCAPLPDALDFSAAAGVSLVGQTALQALRDNARIASGMQVCINGASGGVGSMAVQIACCYDANVTTLSSAQNLDFCREIGAHTALDYAQTDIRHYTDTRFDIFFDVFGNQPYTAVKHLLKTGGTYVTTVPSLRIGWQQVWTSLFGSTRARLVVVQSNTADLKQLRRWIDAGDVRPIVDSIYSLDDIAAAHTRQQTKHARGKVIVTIP